MFTSRALTFFALTLTLSPAFAEKHDKHHDDVFIRGDAGENRIAREVRHELVMLPYYGVFDDLAFSVNGGSVTIGGAEQSHSQRYCAWYDENGNCADWEEYERNMEVSDAMGGEVPPENWPDPD